MNAPHLQVNHIGRPGGRAGFRPGWSVAGFDVAPGRTSDRPTAGQSRPVRLLTCTRRDSWAVPAPGAPADRGLGHLATRPGGAGTVRGAGPALVHLRRHRAAARPQEPQEAVSGHSGSPGQPAGPRGGQRQPLSRVGGNRPTEKCRRGDLNPHVLADTSPSS